MASADPAFAGIVCASNFKHIDLIDLIGPFANGRNYEIGSGVRAKTMGSRDFVTQCMIRWQRSSMISLKKFVEYEVAGQRIAPEPPFHFFDLITKPHRIENGIVR
ncbi:unnamed protein product [Clonostachys rosea f. rosea IK726]|uniref:Uncharacterized protein n=1 Tax=Clonostachys rosea f. rosea IK726 TaxID=1349383 RepID=A0ACA9TWK0_BIOOC|nr:unnamed protein product [Clonostachys rosea f. rosea IK726]